MNDLGWILGTKAWRRPFHVVLALFLFVLVADLYIMYPRVMFSKYVKYIPYMSKDVSIFGRSQLGWLT